MVDVYRKYNFEARISDRLFFALLHMGMRYEDDVIVGWPRNVAAVESALLSTDMIEEWTELRAEYDKPIDMELDEVILEPENFEWDWSEVGDFDTFEEFAATQEDM